jgi:probable phosphoglycerate mutase
MKLYIVRHGETDWNNEKKLQGRSDVPLNDYGRELAYITAEALKDVSFDAIYSSPLIRAYETATILKGDRDIDIIKDERLREMCFGEYEGKHTAGLPQEFWYFFDAPEKYIPTEGGETYEQVLDRAKEFIDTVVVPNSQKMDTMMIVAHGALNKGLMINLNHQEIKDWWGGVFQRNCCVNIYDIDGEKFTLLENGTIYYEEQEGKGYRK